MMIGDRAYRNAVLRAEELRKELAEIDMFLDMYRRFAQSRDGDHASQSDHIVATGELSHPTAQVDHRPASGAADNLENVIREIILANRSPMTRTQIADSLKRRGMLAESTDPANYIGTRMWRAKDQFRNIPGMGYWPSDVPHNTQPDLSYVMIDDRQGEGPTTKMISRSPAEAERVD